MQTLAVLAAEQVHTPSWLRVLLGKVTKVVVVAFLLDAAVRIYSAAGVAAEQVYPEQAHIPRRVELGPLG